MNIPCGQPQVSAGIDWVTCTARSPGKVAALLSLGKDILKQEEGSGGKRQAWHFQGFSGHQAGGVAAGYSGTGTCVRASGATARECATELINSSDNVSRLDIQVTVRTGECGNDHAASLYRSLLDAPRRRGRQLAKTLITSTYTGDTLYLGRRISDSYGRIYNKSAEDKTAEYPPRWRYELELKGKYAKAQALAYVKAEDKETWCTSRIYHWFTDRHAGPPISPLDRCTDSGSSRGSSEEARVIEWLKVGVRPVLKRLAAIYGWPDTLALVGVPMLYSERYINEVLNEEE